ncbi:MAG: lipoyl domain-containing protein [Leptospiraceae bacterium]|nr:lipoyl domain-containing protein [Leptospiraceae bacterium]
MAQEIPLMVPDIGDAEKIEVVAWNIEVGATVSENQELCELVTDKAAFPLECPASGTITSIVKQAGESVKVGDTLAILQTH